VFDVTIVYFSLSGDVLPATDEQTVFATLTYELASELATGDVIDLHFTDVVCANAGGEEVPSMGVDGSISSGGIPGDVNGDGLVNVQDIIVIVNMILEGRSVDATRAEVIITPAQLLLQSDGFIVAVQMTLNHGNYFSIDLTDNAMVADYRTSGNHTTLIVVVPEDEELFTYSGDFDIVDIMVVNGSDEIDVATPAIFTISAAYPNPFNPSTSIALEVAEAGYVSVKIYNLMGQIASTLADDYMHPGNYILTWNASEQVSGMYLVRAETAGYVSTQKLLLIK
jgi:hypothetical protein